MLEFSANEDLALFGESVGKLAARFADQFEAWDHAQACSAEALNGLQELGLNDPALIDDPENFGAVGLASTLRELAKADAGWALTLLHHHVAHRVLTEQEVTVEDSSAWLGWGQLGQGITCPNTEGFAVIDLGDQSGLMPRAEASRLEAFGLRSASWHELPKAEQLSPSFASIGSSDLYDLGTAAISCGLGEAALREGIKYAEERKQFGVAIASFQAIQWKIADSRTEISAGWLLTQHGAWLFDQGRRVDSRAALLSTRAAQDAADRCLQIHGGYGYTKDFAIERIYRDAVALHGLSRGSHRKRDRIATSILQGHPGQ